MARQRRKFEESFKVDTVRVLLASKRPLEQVAKDFDVGPSTLARWRDRYGPELVGEHATGALAGDERAELQMLRRQVRELEEEREILKKAAAFFAKESTK